MTSALVFGRVTHPPFTDRLIPNADTSAWDDLGPRTPVGAVFHTMVGTLWGTDRYFRTGAPALTDYGIGGSTDGPLWDGVILRWNDPTGRRSGWANGGSDGLEGDGPLFVRTMGVNAINRDLVSIERSDGGDVTTPVSPKQKASLCHLTAHWFDQAKVPWDRFPLNPHAGGGIVTHFLHKEFATKGCPWAAVEERIDELQIEIRRILQEAQADGSGGEPIPPQPDHDAWPGGYTVERLADQFGALERSDGRRFAFDPKGVISNAWADRGAKERRRARELPRPQRWYQLRFGQAGAADIVLFAEEWALYRPRPEVAWQWVS